MRKLIISFTVSLIAAGFVCWSGFYITGFAVVLAANHHYFELSGSALRWIENMAAWVPPALLIGALFGMVKPRQAVSLSLISSLATLIILAALSFSFSSTTGISFKRGSELAAFSQVLLPPFLLVLVASFSASYVVSKNRLA